eukprot:417040_1
MPTYVAFGPNDTFVNLNGTGISWSTGLPTNLWNKLNGRYSQNQKQNNSSVSVIDIGEDECVMFMNDGNWWMSHDSLPDVLQNNDISDDMLFASLGPNNSYIIGTNKSRIFWRNIPDRAEELINSRRQYSVIWAALGAANAWFLKFSDGKYYWGGDINNNLSKILRGDKGCKQLFLSAFSSNYYIEFNDGSSEWVASDAFTNDIKSHTDLDPHPILYTQNSISDTFQDGKSIYNVAHDLEKGNIAPEDIPAIRVFTYRGNQYSIDNRRLWVFTKAKTKSVPIIWTKPSEKLKRKIRQRDFDGTSIQIRDGNQRSSSSDCY